MKKLLLTLMGVLIALPGLARDFTYTYEGQTLTYTVLDEETKTCMTKEGELRSSNNSFPGNTVREQLIIPAVVSDGNSTYSVISIGNYGFYKCNSLTSVVIPNSVTSIGISAFHGCSNLESVSISNTVTNIGDFAFYECPSLSSLTIPNSVTTIGNSAFIKCIGLTSLTIPNSVTSIGKSVFLGCSGLESVIIPNSISSIGDYAFYQCSGLLSLTIPNSVTSIGREAFRYCNSLETLYYNATNCTKCGNGQCAFPSTLKKVIFGNNVKNIPSSAFSGCSDLTSVIIPNSVISIGSLAFNGCSGLKKSAYPRNLSNPFNNGIHVAYEPQGALIEDGFIYGPNKKEIRFAPYDLNGEYTISNSVTSIGFATFSGCSNLTSIIIPDAVTSIGDYAFSSCTGLTSVIIPDAVTYIGSSAFSDCTGLTSIIIPNSVTSIGQNIFSNCAGLIKSAYPSNLQNPFSNGVAVAYPYDNAVIENGWITDLNTKAIYFVPVSFEGEYTISSSDIYIGNNAFAGCDGLTSVKCLSTEPPTMHDDSFSGLYDSVKLELYYSSIHNFLPTNWSQFKNINFIDSDSKLSTYETGNLKYILIPAQSKEEKNLAIVIPGDYASLQEITIPERISHPENETIVRYYVDAIGFKAFTGCSNLKTVNFNSRNSSKVIGDYAFAGTGITEITIPGNIKTIGNRAFYGVGNLRSLTLNEGTESIGDEAFCTSIIHSGGNPIYMPSSIKVIGIDAFENLPISRVNIPNLSAWCNIQFKGPYSNPMARSGNLYVNNEEVKELKIPDNVTEIKSYAFINGTNLTSVTLNPSVQSIGTRAFADCMQIKSISIPGNVIQIGEAAFTCGYLDRLSGTFTDPSTSELRKVTLEYGTDIIEIEKDAFPSISQLICNRPLDGIEIKTTQLWDLSIGNNVTKIPASKFKGAKYLTSLSLGNSIKIIEDEAFSGCSRLKEVIIPPSVEVIGASAFAGASNLSSIIMGPNVKNIDEKAYDLCPASTVSITAQTPPVAPDNTFSNYTGVLYVQGQTTVDAYYDADYCWHQFEGIVMIEPTGIDMGNSPTNLMGKPGDSFQLTATLVPADVTLPHVFWRSTNPAIATVDNNGLVTLHADTSEVMAAAEDGEESSGRSCKIIAESLYANGPVAEVTVTDTSTPTGIKNVYDNGESGDIDFNAPIEVYTLQGVRVSDSMKNLTGGIYIVRQGKNVKKIMVK